MRYHTRGGRAEVCGGEARGPGVWGRKIRCQRSEPRMNSIGCKCSPFVLTRLVRPALPRVEGDKLGWDGQAPHRTAH